MYAVSFNVQLSMIFSSGSGRCCAVCCTLARCPAIRWMLSQDRLNGKLIGRWSPIWKQQDRTFLEVQDRACLSAPHAPAPLAAPVPLHQPPRPLPGHALLNFGCCFFTSSVACSTAASVDRRDSSFCSSAWTWLRTAVISSLNLSLATSS